MTYLRHRQSSDFKWTATAALAAGLVTASTVVTCGTADDVFCDETGCQLSALEFERLEGLTGLSTPTPDLANVLTDWTGRTDITVLTPAEELGRLFYHDPRFSGFATQVDITGRIMAQPARAPVGELVNVSCATCHDLRRGGTDPTSVPGHVSIGAGWYDVNSQSTLNSAHYPLKYWNGRYDSLVWQILAVAESAVSMNTTRTSIAWTIRQVPAYRRAYEDVFGDEPLFDRVRETTSSLVLDTSDPRHGQCALVNGACPADCIEEPARYDGCWPRWPVGSCGDAGLDACPTALGGKPGRSFCRPAGEACPAEEGCLEVDGVCWGRAQANFERMSEDDQRAFTRIYVNWAKAINAFEYQLTTGTTPFDRWITSGDPSSDEISAAAKRGARLFVGKASCINCHSGPLMSDGRFYNIGVPQLGAAVPTEADGTFALGWFRGLGIMLANRGDVEDINLRFRTSPGPAEWSDAYPDRQDFADSVSTRKIPSATSEAMKGAWRTPSLRQVAESSPYMHNGFYASLEEVVRHYNQGGTSEGTAPEFLSTQMRPLGLTDREISDLVAFLETLSAERLLVEELADIDLRSPPELPSIR